MPLKLYKNGTLEVIIVGNLRKIIVSIHIMFTDRTAPEVLSCPEDQTLQLNPSDPTNPLTAAVTIDPSTIFEDDADNPVASLVGNYETGRGTNLGNKRHRICNHYCCA